MIIALLFSTALLGGQSVSSRTITDSPPPTRPTTTTAVDGQQQVCRMEAQIGTNVRRRVCRTMAQIEAERREGQDFTTRSQRWNPPPSG